MDELLPVYNGVQFFDTQAQETVQLYTDASLQGMGSFFYENDTRFWSDVVSTTEQNHAFAVPIPISTHINIHEVEAIPLGIEASSKRWSRMELLLIRNTDNMTAYTGLTSHTLRGEANSPLRKVLLASRHYIKIAPR